MFSGIIEEIGCVEKIDTLAQSKKVAISCKKVLSDVLIGDSISVNGVCLTAVSYTHLTLPTTVIV